jgi:hypothetical protein
MTLLVQTCTAACKEVKERGGKETRWNAAFASCICTQRLSYELAKTIVMATIGYSCHYAVQAAATEGDTRRAVISQQGSSAPNVCVTWFLNRIGSCCSTAGLSPCSPRAKPARAANSTDKHYGLDIYIYISAVEYS